MSNREVLTFASCQPVQVTDRDPERPWQRGRPAKSDSAGPWAALGGGGQVSAAPRKQLPVVAQQPVAQHEPSPLVAFDVIGPFEEPALSSRARAPGARTARARGWRCRARAARRHSPGRGARAARRRRRRRRHPGAGPRVPASAAASHRGWTRAAAARSRDGGRAWPHHSSQLGRRHKPPPPGETRPEPPTSAATAARSAQHG